MRKNKLILNKKEILGGNFMESKKNNYIIEAKKKGLEVKCPNINKSSNRYITEDNSIICPLSIIKNVGTIISNNILISADVSRKKRKKYVDKMAASIILQSYLDRRKD